MAVHTQGMKLVAGIILIAVGTLVLRGSGGLPMAAAMALGVAFVTAGGWLVITARPQRLFRRLRPLPRRGARRD